MSACNRRKLYLELLRLLLKYISYDYFIYKRPFFWFLLKAFGNQLSEMLVHRHGYGCVFLLQDLLRECLRVLCLERLLLCAQFIQNDAKRPDIGLFATQAVGLTQPQFRGKVEWCAHLLVLIVPFKCIASTHAEEHGVLRFHADAIFFYNLLLDALKWLKGLAFLDR